MKCTTSALVQKSALIPHVANIIYYNFRCIRNILLMTDYYTSYQTSYYYVLNVKSVNVCL